MFDKQKKIDQIGFGLAYLETSIKTFSTANYNNLAVVSEELISSLFSLQKGYNLVSTNILKSNYPGIDAVDVNAKVGLQITSVKTSAKVNKTLRVIRENNVNRDIDVLYIFMSAGRQSSYSITESCPGVEFSDKNIISFKDLKRLLVEDDFKIAKASELIVKALPSIFSETRERYQALLDNIVNVRSLLDRKAFCGHYAIEEPELMLKAYQETRISIQTSKILHIENKDVANAFSNIRLLISNAEDEVAVKYPDEYILYKHGKTNAFQKVSADCVQILMKVRNEIAREISVIDKQKNDVVKRISTM
ncbi:SMEK domain-containing protein [Superficieibacter sp. 1612_C1]|uniref:SMEK domain-containing protein n=1 Tax=Superficieibacter sp. 1612_C1 TaxID=2780382 RepID=UPI00188435FA|nr:SMEK domain-containing protein [Superficieibacter sp. 1612_C1]